MRLRSRLIREAVCFAVFLACCGDSGDSGGATVAGAGGGGSGGSSNVGGSSASGCVAHVEPRHDGGCAMPCNVTISSTGSDFQFCTTSCDAAGQCPEGLACRDFGIGTPNCEIPCDAGCPAGMQCDVDSNFCHVD